MLLERFVRYNTCLHQAIHYLFNSDLYVSISLLVVKVMLVYYLLGEYFGCYLVIFGLLHWIVQLEVLDIYHKICSIWVGEDAVPMEFGRG